MIESVIGVILNDHKFFKEIIKEISQMINKINLKPQTPEERFSLLRDIIVLIYKISVYIGAVEKHRGLEEETLYPFLEKQKYVNEVRVLLRQHRKIVEYVNDMKKTIAEYRESLKPVENIAKEVIEKFVSIKTLYLKHIDLEEKLIFKILSK